ncbi:MAG: hypothetical protein ACRDRU_01025 [Pseudonocardiaceae bacterium]
MRHPQTATNYSTDDAEKHDGAEKPEVLPEEREHAQRPRHPVIEQHVKNNQGERRIG